MVFRRGFPWLVLCWLLATPVLAEPLTVPYAVRFQGLDDEPLRQLLNQVSLSQREVDNPPPSLLVLRHRAEKDQALLLQALHSRGYFDATVANTLDGEADPVLLTFQVTTGALYHLGPMVVEFQGVGFTPPQQGELGMAEAGEALSSVILEGEAKLLEAALQQGFPFAELQPRRIVANRQDKLLELNFALNLGPLVRLGQARISGAEEVDTAFLQRRVPWQPGAVFHPKLLSDTRKALADTGLFSLVQMHVAQEPEADGLYPVDLQLTPRPMRTIALGGAFSTDQGPSLEAAWSHRNFKSHGESLKLESRLAQNQRHLSGSYGIPDFFRLDQIAILKSDLDQEETDAYRQHSLGGSLGLERTFTPAWRGATGLAYRLIDMQEPIGGHSAHYGLLSLPQRLGVDHSDSLLDPAQGWSLTLHGAPYLETLESNATFLKLRARQSGYWTALKAPRLVLAQRLSAGMLTGAERAQIPADERFFAGGGGSIRGYRYQMVGPLDANNKPLGGLSNLEFSTEARIKVMESLETALFLDGGSAFAASNPLAGDALLLGTGVGARYHTPIGPLRLDVAIPLDKRPQIDSSWQLYVSIGQAF